MKNSVKIGALLFLLILALPSALSAFEAGGGISFFIPETFYTYHSGSVSKEAGISTSLGLGSFLSLPIGLTYIKANGFNMSHAGTGEILDGKMWFSADTFLPHIGLELKLPLGPLFLKGGAGLAGAWIVAPQPFYHTIEQYCSTDDTRYVFESVLMTPQWGWAWQAGGGLGVNIGTIAVEISCTYTDLRAAMNLSSSNYWEIDRTTDTVTRVRDDFDFEDPFQARMRGFSVGLSGSVKL